MSSPAFVPERNEIWYSDGLSGFYAVRLTNEAARIAERRCGAGHGAAWPAARRSVRGTSAACASA